MGPNGYPLLVYNAPPANLNMVYCADAPCSHWSDGTVAFDSSQPLELGIGPNGNPFVAYGNVDELFRNHLFICGDPYCAHWVNREIDYSYSRGVGIDFSVGPDGNLMMYSVFGLVRACDDWLCSSWYDDPISPFSRRYACDIGELTQRQSITRGPDGATLLSCVSDGCARVLECGPGTGEFGHGCFDLNIDEVLLRETCSESHRDCAIRIAFDSSGKTVISYLDFNTHSIFVETHDHPDPFLWHKRLVNIIEIDQPGTLSGRLPGPIALTIGSDGLPVIAYWRWDQDQPPWEDPAGFANLVLLAQIPPY
jgi:hypothetical protein